MSTVSMPARPPKPWKVILAIIVILALALGAVSGCKEYNRYQKRADANNRVKVTAINIRNAKQQALVVEAQNERVRALGEQRIITARALAESQRLIHSTLTPLYVQFEAIEAQKAIATSGKNNTVIYVPAGTNGTPVITQNAQAQNPTTTTATP